MLVQLAPHQGEKQMEASRRLTYLTVAESSCTTLTVELTQTCILSHICWNHLVYLAVSLALLGFGISGTLVAIYGANRETFRRQTMSRLWMGFGISMFATLVLTS